MRGKKPERRRSTPRLVRILRQVQVVDSMSQEDLAARIGVSISMLAQVFSGQRSPGRKFLRGVLRAYPALRTEVYGFLLRDVNGVGEDYEP